ncbi:hypothetical protein EGW08_007413, partial [Elysia chlorotica]
EDEDEDEDEVENKTNDIDDSKDSQDKWKSEAALKRGRDEAPPAVERTTRGFKRDVPLWGKVQDQDLLDIFDRKLKNISGKPLNMGAACSTRHTRSNSCRKDGCLRLKLPESPRDRLAQLIHNPRLTLSDSQHAVVAEMASKVTQTYDVILLTTASSNHFLESQALLQNLHRYVFPALENFALLFYDLGLTARERREMERFCRCTVLTFPFDKLPDQRSPLNRMEASSQRTTLAWRMCALIISGFQA